MSPVPMRPVQVLGMPVRAFYSLAEIREQHVLRVSVISLADSLNFGLVADPRCCPTSITSPATCSPKLER